MLWWARAGLALAFEVLTPAAFFLLMCLPKYYFDVQAPAACPRSCSRLWTWTSLTGPTAMQVRLAILSIPWVHTAWKHSMRALLALEGSKEAQVRSHLLQLPRAGQMHRLQTCMSSIAKHSVMTRSGWPVS